MLCFIMLYAYGLVMVLGQFQRYPVEFLATGGRSNVLRCGSLFCKCLMRKETCLTCLVGLKDTPDAFW